MKTPRELLLCRHEGDEARLDGMRRAVLARMVPARDGQRELSTHEIEVDSRNSREFGDASSRSIWTVGILSSIWRQIVWPCRRVWICLAATWMFIIASNLSLTEPSRSTPSNVQTKTASYVALIEHRNAVIAELADPPTLPVIAPRRSDAGPRSEMPLTIGAG